MLNSDLNLGGRDRAFGFGIKSASVLSVRLIVKGEVLLGVPATRSHVQEFRSGFLTFTLRSHCEGFVRKGHFA